MTTTEKTRIPQITFTPDMLPNQLLVDRNKEAVPTDTTREGLTIKHPL